MKENKSVRQNQNYKIFEIVFAALLVGLVLFLGMQYVTRLVPDFVDKLDVLIGDNYMDIYLSQLSLTFITITITSSLSDNSNIIYWENIAEKKLIRPFWTCFLSYTIYSFVTILYATVAYFVMEEHLSFLVFFFVDVLVLVLLTLNMVDVYYNRDAKKKKLEKEFIAVAKDLEHRREEYDAIILGLREHTINARIENNFELVKENLLFIANNYAYFNAVDNEHYKVGNMEFIFSCLDDNSLDIFNECIRIILKGLKDNDWDTANRISEGLMSENSINFLLENKNYNNQINYLKNVRDVCLFMALRLAGYDLEISMQDRQMIHDTIGKKYIFYNEDMIVIDDEKLRKSLAKSFLDEMKPIFDMAQCDRRVNYLLGENMYNVTYSIPEVAEEVCERMEYRNGEGLWRISAPGEARNSFTGEVLKIFPGGTGIAYETMEKLQKGEFYATLTCEQKKNYLTVHYKELDRVVGFEIRGDFLFACDEEYIFQKVR